MNNINMMNAMVVVIENGLPTCIGFMEAIRNKGIENDLKRPSGLSILLYLFILL